MTSEYDPQLWSEEEIRDLWLAREERDRLERAYRTVLAGMRFETEEIERLIARAKEAA